MHEFYISDHYETTIEEWSPYHSLENQLIYYIEYYWDEQDALHFIWKDTRYNPRKWKKIKLNNTKNITGLHIKEKMRISHRNATWLAVKINSILKEKNDIR